MLTWVLVSLPVILICVFFYRMNRYWKNNGVPYVTSWPPFGTMNKVMFRRQCQAEAFVDIYNAFDSRYIGFGNFLAPSLLIKDLNLLKQIGIKDFDHFPDHQQVINEDMDPLFGKSLASLKGNKWRNMRSILSPAFTGSKMRSMFVLMSECAKQFTNYFAEIAKPNEPITVELKDTFTRFANDIIASTAFGIECNSVKEKQNEFYLMGKYLTQFTFLSTILFLLYEICPSLMKWMGFHIFSEKTRKFFQSIIINNIRSREEKGIIRPDMIHLMMEARKGKLKHEPKVQDEGTGFATVQESDVGIQDQVKQNLSDDDICSQAMVFFFGGFDTISSALCHITYELALNEDIQERLQKEIDDTNEKCNGRIDYETVSKMKYLDMVVCEGLRKWPPVPGTDRACLDTFTIQPEKPGEVPYTLKKDDNLTIPIYAYHRDPKFFPNPEKFDPERFSDENKDRIVPNSYLPFGIGPRNCIASRFALLEAKTLLIHMLSKFNFVVVEKTQIPLKLSKTDFNMNAENGFWIGLKLRNKV